MVAVKFIFEQSKKQVDKLTDEQKEKLRDIMDEGSREKNTYEGV